MGPPTAQSRMINPANVHGHRTSECGERVRGFHREAHFGSPDVPYHYASIGGSGLNSAAAACPRGGVRGNDRGLGDRRAAARLDGRGHDRSFGNGRADDANSSGACWPEWHFQSPTVAGASSASIEAMIAWMGIRPLADECGDLGKKVQI